MEYNLRIDGIISEGEWVSLDFLGFDLGGGFCAF
jgi:hypothetical protein